MKKILSFILKILLFFLILFILCALILYGVVKYTFSKEYTNQKIEEVVNKKRNEIMYTKLEDVDKKYLKALIAAEDHRFYEHKGIDKIAVMRAINNNLRSKKIVEGGSTITQQLLKNLFFSQEVSFNRKLKEFLLTQKFEKMYSKDEILELYINTSYFGSGYYNILEASLGYFKKRPNNLTKTESIFLAGVPNAPSKYDPRVSIKKAHQRRNQVLAKMVEENVITKEEAKDLSKEKIEVVDVNEGKKEIEIEKQKRLEKRKHEFTK